MIQAQTPKFIAFFFSHNYDLNLTIFNEIVNLSSLNPIFVVFRITMTQSHVAFLSIASFIKSLIHYYYFPPLFCLIFNLSLII